MEKSLIIAGFGGQGVMLIGKTLGYSANDMGKNATFFPAYGTEQRGGTANCTVIISDEEIGCPVCETFDTIIAMNEPSFVRFAPALKEGGEIIINSSLVSSRPEGGVKFYEVDSAAMANEIGNPKVANMVILGAYVAANDQLDLNEVKNMVKKSLGSKTELIDLNMKAIDAGYAAVKE
jgi:2-oxoglutarate ferredoxin oxidoreductase subunit gamma